MRFPEEFTKAVLLKASGFELIAEWQRLSWCKVACAYFRISRAAAVRAEQQHSEPGLQHVYEAA